MNVVLHVLAGGAIAHAAFVLAARRPSPGLVASSGTALASIAAHGLLDWLRHGYPIPSALDVVGALALSGMWLLRVRPGLRPLFAVGLAASLLPDVVDHLPRLLHLTSPLHHPIFPWHSPAWSGSLYPSARIRPGSQLVALEGGNNALVSFLNHALVVAISLGSVYVGRSAFERAPAVRTDDHRSTSH